MAERLIDKAEVARRYSIHPKTVEAWERAGKLPRRIPGWIGTEPRWRESDVDGHILSMVQAERKEQVA